MQALVYTVLLSIIGGLVVFINRQFLQEQYWWHRKMGPSVLSAEAERQKALKLGPGSEFTECIDGCPAMIVVPAGKFMMGSPADDGNDHEKPRREVTFAKPFAAGKTEVTFAEWASAWQPGHAQSSQTTAGVAGNGQ